MEFHVRFFKKFITGGRIRHPWRRTLRVADDSRSRILLRYHSTHFDANDNNDKGRTRGVARNISRYRNIWEIPAAPDPSINVHDHVRFRSVPESSVKWTSIASQEWDDKKDNRESISESKSRFNAMLFFNLCSSESIQRHTIKHLLPNGYPLSVHPAYTRYALYSFIANTVSTTTMILSTQTLLLAVGVGQHAAAPISATLNWILKDGIGQFGGILFASKISSSSNSVDADPKKWRMVSSLAMDCAMMTELMTSAFPGYFVLIASVANIGKNIAFLTASASRAKLHQCLCCPDPNKQLAADNLGDITGKSTSQSILASLLGTAIGMGVSPFLLNDLFSVTAGCMILSCVNQVCTYQSLKHIPLNRLNRQRLMLLLKVYFQEMTKHNKTQEDMDVDDLSPERICKMEGFIPLIHHDDSLPWLRVGCDLMTIAPNGPDQLSRLHQPPEQYVLRYQHVSNSKSHHHRYYHPMDITSSSSPVVVYLTFMEDAKNEDILRGTFQAFTIWSISRGELSVEEKLNPCDPNCTDIMTVSYDWMNTHMDDFQKRVCASGWLLDDGVRIMLESENSKRLRFDRDTPRL